MLKNKIYYIVNDNYKGIVYRRNPDYPEWHCFTMVKCKDCGESYEPICEVKHICKTQNSYPFDESGVENGNA